MTTPPDALRPAGPGAPRQPHDVLVSRLLGIAQVASELNAAPDVAAVTQVVTTRAAAVLGAVDAALVVGPFALQDEADEADGQAAREAARTGRLVTAAGPERSVVALPLLASGECLGVMRLTFSFRYHLTDVDRQFLQTVADTCAQALSRIAAQAAERDRYAQMSFLTTASAELASSLDYEQTLQRLARLVVPELAHWCVIDLLDDGALRPVAVAHVDPDKVELARQMRETYPPDLHAPSGAHVVARTGVPQLFEDIDPALLAAAARDDEHRRLATVLDLRSAVLVPLIARDRTLGVLTLVRTGDARRYAHSDLAFAEELAHRAAVAIDNAQLHSETLEASLQLQRAVLPASFDDTGRWDIAVHYRPAGRTAVGGDFYDAVQLADGRLAVSVGDVMGRGVMAAAAMAQVRSALRAYVALDPDPRTVIDRLAVMFEQLDLPQLVTVLYAVIDPRAGSAQLLSAGHLPPLLVSPDGAVTRLVVPSSPPLGAGEHERDVVTVDLGPGDALLLVTDGLVERRGEDIDAGLGRLLLAARALAGDVTDARLAAIADELRQAGHDDDVTLLAVRARLGYR